MLRITIHGDKVPRRFQLEGKLADPWIIEAENAWRLAYRAGRPPVVDLAGVTAVDDAGRKLLEAMNRAGATFLVEGVKMKALIDEIKPAKSRKPRTGKRTSRINRR